MKKHLPPFLAGMQTATLIFGLGTAALVVTGAIGTVSRYFMPVRTTSSQEPTPIPAE